MYCPRCRSEKVTVQAVNVVSEEKKKKSLAYWLLIGWLWEPFAWLFLTLPKLLFAMFGKKTKIVSKTETYAVCQNCGNKWLIK